MSSKKLTFEDSFSQLTDITEQLESGNLSLDDSMKLYQKGIELIRYCNNKLEEAERRITVLTKNENGELIESDFEE